MKRPASEEGYELTLGAPEGPAAEVAPEPQPATPREWVRRNLFHGPVSGALTIVVAAFAAWLLWKAVVFFVEGADWSVLKANLRVYVVGSFPLEETWRVWACVYALALLVGLSRGALARRDRPSRSRVVWRVVLAAAFAGGLFYLVESPLVIGLVAGVPATVVVGSLAGRAVGDRIRRLLLVAWILAFPFVIVVLQAFDGVKPGKWGGFLLNVLVAVVAIFVSFPIGILLALGRRSTLPAVRVFCVGFIEFIRGVPLAALIVFGIFVLPLLLPPSIDPPNIVLAMTMYVIFSAAYVAEIVRGGLQGVAEGQYEASRALGLRYPRMMRHIVLPQALRNTIPAMISHFISLFKDTSLLVVVGLFSDLASAANRATRDLDFVGREIEAILPAAFIFWVVAFWMSRWSQRVEIRVGVGER